MDKLERRKLSIKKWKESKKGNGIIESYLGFGKSKYVTDIKSNIDAFHKTSCSICIVVPNSSVKKQWEVIAKNFNFISYSIIHFKQVSNILSEFDLVIYDELQTYIHRLEFLITNIPSKWKLGLSNILSDIDKKNLNTILPIVDTINYNEALKYGWNNTIEYNLNIDLIEEERALYESISKEISIKYEYFNYDLDMLSYARRNVRNSYYKAKDEDFARDHEGAEYVAKKLHNNYLVVKGNDGKLKTIKDLDLFEFLNEEAEDLFNLFKERKLLIETSESIIEASRGVVYKLGDKKDAILFSHKNDIILTLHKLLKNSEKFYNNLPTIEKQIEKVLKYKTQKAADRNAIKKNGIAYQSGQDWCVKYKETKKIGATKQQKDIIDRFNEGKFNYLISNNLLKFKESVKKVDFCIKMNSNKNSLDHSLQKAYLKHTSTSVFINIVINKTISVKNFELSQKNSNNIRNVSNINEILI